MTRTERRLLQAMYRRLTRLRGEASELQDDLDALLNDRRTRPVSDPCVSPWGHQFQDRHGCIYHGCRECAGPLSDGPAHSDRAHSDDLLAALERSFRPDPA